MKLNRNQSIFAGGSYHGWKI